MADESPSLYNLIEELGFSPSEHQFLLRLYGSSDPFAGLPGADPEASYSQDQSGQLSSTSIAHRLVSTRLCERANQFRLRSTHRHPSDLREGLEGRDLVHYEQEWTSLIATDSESLISDLLQQLVTDDEHPCLEPPELPEHPKASENATRPGSVGPASSSVYDNEIGEPPASVDNLNEIPGTQGNCEASQEPRTLNHPGSFERLLESFPRPPGRNQTVEEQNSSHVYPKAPRVPQKDSAQANTSTLTSSQIKPVTSLPRISRFSEDLGDNNPIEEQNSSNICAKADTSALDTSGLGNTPAGCSGISPSSSINTPTVVNTQSVSLRIPSPSPNASFRELRLPIDYHEGRKVNPESSHQAQEERAHQYTIFPEYSSRVRPIGYVIRKQHSLRNIFEARPTPTASPRYYQKTPLRISSRPSTISFASGKRSTKCKRNLKRLFKKLKRLLCQTRNRSSSALKH